MGALDWKHHTLIQALLSRGPLLETDFHSLFTSLTGNDPGILLYHVLGLFITLL